MKLVSPKAMLKSATLIQWLEQQPPNGHYSWTNVEGKCLFSQYMNAHGYDGDPQEGENIIWLKLHEVFPDIIFPATRCGRWDATYGKALERARRALRNEDKSKRRRVA